MKEKAINILIQLFGKELKIDGVFTSSVSFYHKNKLFNMWCKTLYVEEIEDGKPLPNSPDAKRIGIKIREFIKSMEE